MRGSKQSRAVWIAVALVVVVVVVLVRIGTIGSSGFKVQLKPRNSILVPKPFIAPKTRNEIAQLLENEGFLVGVELGVQHGGFASHNLRIWKSCTRYYLVDIWRSQANYKDFANVDDKKQEEIYLQAKNNLKAFEGKTVFLRNTTTEAAVLITEPLDFVYVDARHDYCGAKEDILAYWPKVKPGGIMAGHDYLRAPDVLPDQDWSVCMDGTKNDGAVKGAVDEFAAAHNLTVVVTYSDPPWSSWIIRKPEAVLV